MDLSEQIKSDINENPIILFMKGTKRNADVWIFKSSGSDFKPLWC